MNITTLKEILQRYLDGRASGKEKMLLNTWSGNALESARKAPLSLKGEQQRKAALAYLREATGEKTPTHKVVWLHKTWKLAAACIILIGSTSLLYQYKFALLDMIDPIPMQKITAQQFEVKKVTLPDSSVVILNAGSELTFPKTFRGRQRKVQLNGEAYFTVTPNPSSAFTITSSHLQVQVLGTSFVMTDSSNIAAAQVSVKTGRVAVTPDAEGAAATQLSADQALVFHQENGIVNITKGQEVNIAWTSKRLVFNHATLAVVFQQIAQAFQVKIEVADATITDTKFTGAFDADDSLTGMLNVIALSYRLSIHKSKDGTIMIR